VSDGTLTIVAKNPTVMEKVQEKVCHVIFVWLKYGRARFPWCLTFLYCAVTSNDKAMIGLSNLDAVLSSIQHISMNSSGGRPTEPICLSAYSLSAIKSF